MKRKIEEFAEEVGAEVLGVPVATIRAALDPPPATEGAGEEGEAATAAAEAVVDPKLRGIDISSIIEIIGQVITQIMSSCPASRESQRDAINKPNLWQRILTRAEVAKVCQSCAYTYVRSLSGKIADALIKRAAAAPDEVVYAIMDETQAVNNWI